MVISDGRTDWALKLLAQIHSVNKPTRLVLDFAKTQSISPAGHAILACIIDALIEQRVPCSCKHIPRKLNTLPVIQSLLNVDQHATLPHPKIHNTSSQTMIMQGIAGTINVAFTEQVEGMFAKKISEDTIFAVKLILNELMQNSVDHSSSERYYIYAGIWENELHAGALDMGVSIPTKLSQKYLSPDDIASLEKSMEKGVGTRRTRPGGLGLFYFFELLKSNHGKLTMISRRAQVRRYFKTRRSQKNLLKNELKGTWCFARFPIDETGS